MQKLFTFLFLASSCIVFSQEVELVIPTGHTSQIKKIVLNEDSSYVASIQNTSAVTLWNRKSGEIERVVNLHTGRANDLLFRDELLISAGDDMQAILWDTKSKTVQRSLEHSQQIAAVYNDEKHLSLIHI